MIRFGPSGNSKIFYDEGHKSSIEAPAWLKSKGLTAYEYSFGRGYNMTKETAVKLGEKAKENDILISAHAPFYINFANPSDEMAEKSFMYVLTGLKFLEWFNGEHLVVHLATQGKMERAEALELTKKRLINTIENLKKLDINLNNKYICPETMGKFSQIGNAEEIIDFCALDEMFIPTFDFGHLNCLTAGKFNSKDEYKRIFDLSFEKLGEFKTKNCHIHFSKIQYSAKGEIKHLNFDDELYGPNFEPLAEVLLDYKLEPTIICESADFMAEDAMKMLNIYENAKKH